MWFTLDWNIVLFGMAKFAKLMNISLGCNKFMLKENVMTLMLKSVIWKAVICQTPKTSQKKKKEQHETETVPRFST